ncbi:MAG: transposase [Candidatus Marinimicrobia bacterium]|nr:transposase [Candidatus Neomarinimicrobiota bacterium]
MSGEVKCKASYLGGKRGGTRGSGSRGKAKVFGLLERQVRIFAAVADNVSGETVMADINYFSAKGRVFKAGRF